MIKGTTHIAGYEFKNEDVVIDFSVFESCSFENCRIIYYGQGPFNLSNNSFQSCKWVFFGAASNTLEFLRHMYHGADKGGRALVEATFDNIRKNVRQIDQTKPQV